MRSIPLVGAVLLLVVAAGAASADDHPTVVTGRVSAGVVSSGDAVRFGGSGFAPRSAIALTSEGGSVGTTRADAAGSFMASVPTSGRGFRALAGSGVDAAGRPRIATVTVRVVAASAPAHRPAEPTALALLTGFGIVAVGAGGRLARYRRAAGAPVWP